MSEERYWRFCVVGNIVKTHPDEDGVIRYGTKAFTGGTKVYIPWKDWYDIDNREGILVIGLNRFHRYATEYVPFELLENIRFQILFKSTVLRIIGGEETLEGFYSWGRTAEDKRGAKAFAERLSKRIDEVKKGGIR